MERQVMEELRMEAEELNSKISRLEEFLFNESVMKKLDIDYRKEMWMQHSHMCHYLKNLTTRIAFHQGGC